MLSDPIKGFKLTRAYCPYVMPEAKVDDRYTEGVYYDGTVGEFFTFDRSEDGTHVELLTPITNESVETLSAKEFHNIQDELWEVPEEAMDDPVAYFENWVSRQSAHADFDVGRLWAQKATEIVEVGEV